MGVHVRTRCAEAEAYKLAVHQTRQRNNGSEEPPSGVAQIVNGPCGGSSHRLRPVYVQRNTFSNSAYFELSCATACYGSSLSVCVCLCVCEMHNFWMGSSQRRAI